MVKIPGANIVSTGNTQIDGTLSAQQKAVTGSIVLRCVLARRACVVIAEASRRMAPMPLGRMVPAPVLTHPD